MALRVAEEHTGCMDVAEQMTMTLAAAEDLAAQTLAAIDEKYAAWLDDAGPWPAADRERVASDLAGFREASVLLEGVEESQWTTLHRFAFMARVRYDKGLRRTAALYGVSELPTPGNAASTAVTVDRGGDPSTRCRYCDLDELAWAAPCVEAKDGKHLTRSGRS